MRARFELEPEFVGIEPDQAIGRPWRDDADEARTLAGQGHERERAAFGVELGRGVVMRAGVREVEGQSCLTGRPAGHLDARRDPARGFVAVGADQQLPA